ncbi:MAG TPA: serine/threonine-protein kinase, partial [Thermomicrobiales bacterium]|nr:serine/threonine-protein kinase [Thermomicrobiales bacterium]
MAVLCAGERLGNYVIEGPLGQGGMAEVYRGVHRLLERPVAIKVLSPALNADPTFPLRFLREARAVARLTHPHIVAVYDFDEYGELAYLVMQLATNGTLRDRARHFRTLADAVASLAAVGEALQYAHERGIVHRDVKPINVLIDDAGRPLLADFGLARLAHESLDLTLTGVSIGSPHYMAPEQALGHEVDHRADIYAYGIMACEVIAGRPPYVGPTPWAIIQQHLAAPPPSIRTFLPAAPAALEGALRRATAKRADERYAAIADLVADLRLAAAAAPDLSLDQRRATGAEDRPRGASGSHPSVARPTGSPGPTPPSVPPTPDVGDHTPDRPGDPDTATLLRPAGERPAWPVDPALATRMMPVATPPAAASAVAPPLPTPPLGPALATAVPPAPPRSRRPSAFEWWHWGIIGAVVAVLAGLGIAVVGRGGAAGAGDALRVGLLAVALLLAILNATLMRVAVLSDSHLARETYRRLRQQHRFVGYTAALLAIVAQALLWLALVHDGFTSPWLTPSFVSGLALLAAAVLKVGIVRFIPRWRRHLPVVAVVLLLCFVLALATNIGALLAPAVRPAITVAAPVPAATAAAVASA